MRRLYVVLIGVAILVFLAVSALLARVYSADGAEQSAITALIRDEARGDGPAAIARIAGCGHSSACRARLRQNISALRRPGTVATLQVAPSTGFTLAGTVGVARIAYTIGSSLPIVQCVRIHRVGSVLQSRRIELLAISPRIKSDADCPAKF